MTAMVAVVRILRFSNRIRMMMRGLFGIVLINDQDDSIYQPWSGDVGSLNIDCEKD